MKPILEVHQLSKRYKVSHHAGGYLSLRERIQNVLKFRNNKKEDFFALDDVSFEVQAGESIGIIGRNGAGKSTLLKILSKITRPSQGRIITRGRIASLLEVGTGFHPELTGRENIFFNGSLLGMKHMEIESKFDEIVDFSGVEKFLDTPLKHFSSGMQLRLAFSVAAFLEPEILIIDEVLAVGDAEFQRKCLGKMDRVSKSGRTILFVSHNLGAVSQLCSSSLLLQSGKLVARGPTPDIIMRYLKSTSEEVEIYAAKKSGKKIFIKEIRPFNDDKVVSSEFKHDEPIFFRFLIHKQVEETNYRLLVIVQDNLKRRIFSSETLIDALEANLCIEPNTLVRGNYSLHCIIYIPGIAQYDVVEDGCPFVIVDGGSAFSHLDTFDYGAVFARTTWRK